METARSRSNCPEVRAELASLPSSPKATQKELRFNAAEYRSALARAIALSASRVPRPASRVPRPPACEASAPQVALWPRIIVATQTALRDRRMAPSMHRRWQQNFRRASEIAGAEVRRGHQLSVTSVALCDTNVLGHSSLSRPKAVLRLWCRATLLTIIARSVVLHRNPAFPEIPRSRCSWERVAELQPKHSLLWVEGRVNRAVGRDHRVQPPSPRARPRARPRAPLCFGTPSCTLRYALCREKLKFRTKNKGDAPLSRVLALAVSSDRP